MPSLEPLLNPRSIAILGASTDFGKINGRTLKFLLDKGYRGKIYPVNPKYPRVGGLACYPDVASLPEAPDLAVVAVPARAVTASLRELGARGARAAVVFSSGFGEMGEAGRALEQEAAAAARAGGLRLLGPNCLGYINAWENAIATFGQYAEGETPPGPVAFVTQSGAFGTAIAALARRRGLGLGYFVNTGNEADVDFVEVMRALIEDPRVKVGAGYLEALRDGAGLAELAESALRAGKPLVLTKVGRTAAGARAAASHTGALASADSVFEGVASGRGIVRGRNEEHMLDLVEALSRCPLPGGAGLAIVTQSGGAGVLAADRAEELGLPVPVLAGETQRRLKDVIPAFGSSANPVDVTGQFVAEPGLLRDAVRIVLEDPAVHIALVWLQLMETHVEALLEIFGEIQAAVTKPFVVCWVAAPERALAGLRARGIAALRGAEPAVEACAALTRYAAARRDFLAGEPARAALRVPRLELPATGGPVAALEVRALLGGAGVQTVACELARDADAAAAAADRLGYPVALKIESPDILHKTEAGGVRLNLSGTDAVRRAFLEIVESARRHQPGARVAGVIVQAMAAGAVEMVVGLRRDRDFGTVVMAGLGGIHVEVLKDVVFRPAPVTPAEAGRMLDALRGRALLDGVRGAPAVDRAALARLISSVSCLGVAAGSRLESLDLNPVLAGPTGAVAVDWRLLLTCD
jgi:acetyltransferase